MIARLIRPIPFRIPFNHALPRLASRRNAGLVIAGAVVLSTWPAAELWSQANDVGRPAPARGLAPPNLTEILPATPPDAPAQPAVTEAPLNRPSSAGITPLTAAELCGDLGAAGTLDGSGSDDNARQGAIAYCANIADEAADARYARKLSVLAQAEAQIEERLAELETRRQAAEEWLRRRSEFMQAAHDSLVDIIAAMRADAAALQLAELDPMTAAAVIARLSPRDASAILTEMNARDGARLAGIIAGLHQRGIDGSSTRLMNSAGDNIPTLTPGGRS